MFQIFIIIRIKWLNRRIKIQCWDMKQWKAMLTTCLKTNGAPNIFSIPWIVIRKEENPRLKGFMIKKSWNHVENHRKTKSYVVIKGKQVFPHQIFIKQDNHEIISYRNKKIKQISQWWNSKWKRKENHCLGFL